MKLKVRKDGTLLQILMAEGGYSTTTKARQVIKNGAVWVNNKIEKVPSAVITAGTPIEINAERSRQEARHAKYLFKVLFEDQYFIATVKPSGMSVLKAKGGKPSFKDVVLHALENTTSDVQQIFPVTHVDTNATGIILFAKQQKTHLAMQGAPVAKLWLCLVEGRLKEQSGTISNPVVKTKTGKVIAIEKATRISEDAQTQYRVRREIGKFSLVEAIIPDEPHNKQLQAHFQFIGNPVAGEKRYGSTIPFKSRCGIHLLAIKFEHPVTKKMVEITSNIPQTFTRAGRYA